MSPGATFERVYGAIKQMLLDGELPPGTPIEPAVIGREIAASITPVRDALHRLTGERLVEAPNHNGFRVPLLSEAALRDLYQWNGRVLGLAARQVQPASDTHLQHSGSIEEITATLFLRVAQATESAEHVATVGSLNDRLTNVRRAEVATLPAIADEITGLESVITAGDKVALMAALTRYHRRRIAAVAGTIAHLMSLSRR
ncbi:regulatory protein, gntR family [Sphingomonas sp. NFR04]|uniref:GntR family transcriptional regulator n=1 Tax=Sphingomonas sp. NFR04 TaxID=1566283 RepID=UPI0008ED76C1|nr:GntR family transcriptional regulator [Sphingomonas sp. NFR04]SFJ96968.1 regulatory protein, gntR family [Sphingomonas sp. NFR04]